MNKRNRKRSEKAAHWFIWRLDRARGGEVQHGKLRQWVQRLLFGHWTRVDENREEYLAMAGVHAVLKRWDLDERKRESDTSNVVPLFDDERGCPRRSPEATPCAQESAPRIVMSRREMVAAALAGVTIAGVGAAALTRVIGTRREDVVATGHVLRVSLRDGLMHAARHTAFGLHPNDQAHTVFLHSGLAGFHLWRNPATPTHVTTMLGELFAAAARFYVLVLDSLVEITVAEGSVRVRSSLLNAAEVVVNAGQKLTLRPGGVLVQPIGLTHAKRGFAWTEGYFDFDGETFGEAAAAFNRFNELQIVLTPKAAGLIVASSRSPLNDPERFVRRIAEGLQLEVHLEGQRIQVFERDTVRGAR